MPSKELTEIAIRKAAVSIGGGVSKKSGSSNQGLPDEARGGVRKVAHLRREFEGKLLGSRNAIHAKMNEEARPKT